MQVSLMVAASLAMTMPAAFAADVVIPDGVLTRGAAECVLHTPITVGVGDSVVWHNADSARRTMVSDDSAPSSFVVGIPADGKASHTFTEPGEYPYYCLLRPSLGGTIIVLEGTSVDHKYGPPLGGMSNGTADAARPGAESSPESPAILSILMDSGKFPALGGAMGVDTYRMDSSYYTVVAGSGNDGVQIIDITNASAPVPASYVYGRDIPGLDHPYGVAAYSDGETHMALTVSRMADSVQALDVSDGISHLWTTHDGEALGGVSRIAVMDNQYALAASQKGVQALNLTDGYPVSFVALNGTHGIDVYGQYVVVSSGGEVLTINYTDVTAPHVLSAAGNPDVTSDWMPRGVSLTETALGTLAFVAWSADDAESGGLQVLNVTDMAAPVHVSWVTDPLLDGAHDVAVAGVGSDTYALVTAYRAGTLAVVDVTDPAAPSVASSVGIPAASHVSYVDGRAAVTAGDSLYVVCVDGMCADIPKPQASAAPAVFVSFPQSGSQGGTGSQTPSQPRTPLVPQQERPEIPPSSGMGTNTIDPTNLNLVATQMPDIVDAYAVYKLDWDQPSGRQVSVYASLEVDKYNYEDFEPGHKCSHPNAECEPSGTKNIWSPIIEVAGLSRSVTIGIDHYVQEYRMYPHLEVHDVDGFIVYLTTSHGSPQTHDSDAGSCASEAELPSRTGDRFTSVIKYYKVTHCQKIAVP